MAPLASGNEALDALQLDDECDDNDASCAVGREEEEEEDEDEEESEEEEEEEEQQRQQTNTSTLNINRYIHLFITIKCIGKTTKLLIQLVTHLNECFCSSK